FVLRAEHRGVNAFVQRHAKCDSVLPELLAGCAAVNLAHINEVWSAEQRRRSCQVDVIRKHHPRAGYKVRVQCTRSIRENETAQSTAVHPTNVRSDFDRGPTFVEMDTPGSDEDDFSAEPAEDKASSVSGNFRMRKSFNFGVRDALEDLKAFDKTAQAGAQDDSTIGLKIAPVGHDLVIRRRSA